jgi:hypothetical protein
VPLSLFPEFGLVAEVFADPALATKRRHRDAVLGYLRSPDMSPLPLRRLAARDPQRASQVFQQVLRKPRFSWERDGEALLRRRKLSYVGRTFLPSCAPMGDALADEIIRSQAGAVTATRPN